MRNIVVTGGSRGLGLGIAKRLAGAGYSVIAVARGESDGLAAAIAEAGKTGTGALHFAPFDLAETDAIPAFAAELRKSFGGVYGLVNNAGIGTSGMLANMHNSQIESLIRLNTLAPIVLTKYLVRSMMAEGEGRIVNIASIVASNGYSGLSVYSATKASLVGFTRSLAREVGKVGVTVNAIAPGFMETDMTHGMDDTQHTRLVRRSALRRLAEVDDVAQSVEYLLGDAGRNITGTLITIDAGSTT
ncbi:MAG: SDR family NAD(P)-dependent oxidoreductase [Bauldia sp.]|uniref:SDR family NAD(P)-dependent oxidoreductase n=1 Tax=Bauldia sp. TaxID=2575872 RepID=UPI001D4CC515|nr:SDR family NAD(P)-dependent oxidoreductase [Bauldia sp.]MCB1494716.1 SDR family NAD(P)-dependent oxidoreductase [Bauldia sp.]